MNKNDPSLTPQAPQNEASVTETSTFSLASVRAKLDEIDGELHRLMMERTALARDVWRNKDKSVAALAAVRPAREAQMLARFAENHKGQMPLPVVWRIWRELIIANIRAQSPIEVHVAAEFGEDANGHGDKVWDLARAHFGFETQMTRHGSADGAMEAARKGAVAVVSSADVARWGPESMSKGGIRIFSALPQLVTPDGATTAPRAFLVGDVELEPAGADTSVIGVWADEATAKAAAEAEGHSIVYVQPLKYSGPGADNRQAQDMTLLGVDGFAACGNFQGKSRWGDCDVLALGTHPNATIWQQEDQNRG